MNVNIDTLARVVIAVALVVAVLWGFDLTA
jgi:hypothetical protein